MRLLAGFDLLDGVLVAAEQISMLTLAVGAYLGVFDRGVCLFAILTIGHGGERLDLQLGVFEIGRVLYRPVPAVLNVLRDYSADLADLKRNAADRGEIILNAQLLDLLYDASDGFVDPRLRIWIKPRYIQYPSATEPDVIREMAFSAYCDKRSAENLAARKAVS